MSLFSVGGNTGFALGADPDHARRAGVRARGHAARRDPARCWSRSCSRSSCRTCARRSAAAARGGRATARDDRARTTGRVRAADRGRSSVRSGIYFGLQSFAPIWLIHEYGASEAARQRGAGRDARRGRARARSWAGGSWTGSAAAACWSARSSRRSRCCSAFMLAPERARRRRVLLAGDRLRDRDVVQRLGRDGAGVPAEPARDRLRASRSGWRSAWAAIAAALLGVLADHAGLATVMWTIAALPLARAWRSPHAAADRRTERDALPAGDRVQSVA